jgi:hypothetical protein
VGSDGQFYGTSYFFVRITPVGHFLLHLLPFRGCTKSLLEPGCIDELFRPGKPFQKPKRDIFVQMGLGLQRKWLKKPLETQQWEMASLAFSYSLY